MFYQAGTMGQNFVLDVSELDTSSVTNMSGMFFYTGYDSTNFTLDVSNFDTSNVTNMDGMFLYTGTMSRNIMLDVSNFDTSNVTNMNKMFAYVGAYNEQFTLDVSNFDTSNVIYMANMFYYTGYSSQNFNTNFTIRNANIESYNKVFTNVATQPGSKITVHYTTETETIVDEMIASLSPGSNVVKGWNVDKEKISFDIEGTTYNAIEGMTWEQWVNSELNTDGYYIYYDF
jgi:surface protein